MLKKLTLRLSGTQRRGPRVHKSFTTLASSRWVFGSNRWVSLTGVVSIVLIAV
jgi:hypothetical protein